MEKSKQILELIDQTDSPLSKEEAIQLLKIKNDSMEFYQLLAKANELSRKEYDSKGYIFVQIGLNSAPCSGNCKFCSMAQQNYVMKGENQKELSEILSEVDHAERQKVDAIFLMTTADYDMEQYLEMGREVKKHISKNTMLIANVGDFDLAFAKRLKEAGFYGVYHIVRLREGEDTDLAVAQRIQTLDAIRDAGLELLYCIEPIGPEHTYEEIADEMIRARDYHVNIMACMKRVNVLGTKFCEVGEITDLELTKIAAVTRLVTRPKKSMNVHEPKQMSLLAGINQLYAEVGVNPRDCEVETSQNRGKSIEQMKDMLMQAEYHF